MAQIYITDFKEKRVVKSYDSQIELQNRLNNVTCSLCQGVYDKRGTVVLQADIMLKGYSATVSMCSDCIIEMGKIVEERNNEA